MQVAEHLVENIAELINFALTGATTFFLLFRCSPRLAVTAILLAPISSFAMSLCSGPLKKLSGQHLDALASSTHRAASRFAAIKAIRVYRAEAREKRAFNEIIDDAHGISLKMAAAESFFAGAGYLNSHGVVLITFVLGTQQVIAGKISIGQVTKKHCPSADTFKPSPPLAFSS